ncbi:hypothetical protein EVAR_102430_1 [Eumeta japonica]|uniref:Uncharacterized protein n=1 Tax=Eumeta variegata TaxID=151549 RepID=A0A4C1YZ17_EUMVA|nr:hypothetical protein EVAR_102430_1 [Eumeta japonica]
MDLAVRTGAEPPKTPHESKYSLNRLKFSGDNARSELTAAAPDYSTCLQSKQFEIDCDAPPGGCTDTSQRPRMPAARRGGRGCSDADALYTPVSETVVR